jgi:hypothetical protein
MKVAVVGSRNFADRLRLFAELDALQQTRGPFDAIVSGGARGADQLAEAYAGERRLLLYVIRPDWRMGRGAGVARNAEIVRQADLVAAFWDGRSPGTRSSIELARKANKPVVVVRTDAATGA